MTATGVREVGDYHVTKAETRNISEGNNPSVAVQSAMINNVQYTIKPNLVG